MVKNLNFTLGSRESLKCFKRRNGGVRFAFQKSLALWRMAGRQNDYRAATVAQKKGGGAPN